MNTTDKDTASPQWEREALMKIAQAGLIEQRRARRWGIFFKLLGFGYLFILLAVMFAPGRMGESTPATTGPHTALVELNGIIMDGEEGASETVIRGLRKAFEDKNAKGVILRINSPGGSPVQAGLIHDEMLRLREKHPNKPLHVVVTDICASGGYYAAVAGEQIHVDKASIVGSIGVRMDSFGFVGAMEKLGVERRLLTAGQNKGLLDPFAPVVPEEKQHIQTMLDQIHGQFIEVVKNGRGERLSDNPNLFTGLIWTGDEAIRLGLADARGSVESVARDVIGAEKLVNVTPKPDVFERVFSRIGTQVAQSLVSASFVPLPH
ncbi:MAG: S49 family peptidase [Halothiobacillaceae bacterium]|nr:S49 family peptidase [Halothiobacillaceae bacterium]